MLRKLFLIISFLNIFQLFLVAQNPIIDSLSRLARTERSDTLKIKYLDDLCWEYQTIGEYDSALHYGNASLDLAKELERSSSTPAIKIRAQKGIAQAYSDIGIIFKKQGDYSKTLEYFFKALKINEQLGDKKGIAKNIGNIGIVYYDQRDFDKALTYYFKSLKLREDLGNKGYIAIQLGNIANVYYDKGEYSKALEYNFKALKIKEEIGDENGIGITLGNIGSVYYDQQDYPKALEYFLRSLKIKEAAGDKFEIAISLGNIGSLYTKQKKYDEAEKYLLRSLALADSVGALTTKMQFEKLISDLYFTQGDYLKAYEHNKQYGFVKDSLFNIEKHKDLTRKEMDYEYEKKEAAIKAENEKQAAVAAAESKKQKIIILFAVVGLLLMIVFAIYIFRSLRYSQKQKHIIELQKQVLSHQKDLVEQKHKEISDSINYAERIQRALLASKKLLDENLSSYFILFKPKDVVSGDFYWATKLSNNNFVLVTADSTGHGVPGAIMSILNIACLKEAVSKGITRPDLLLNETRELVIENLKHDGSLEGGKDGMDCNMISFDIKNKLMSCASANNPVWVIRDRSLIEIKPDRMPIGKHEKDKTPFTLQTFTLQSGDLIYTLTDGYADQFGGLSGKKFKNKQLQELLLSIAHEEMETQKQKLNEAFDLWKRNLEQIDDVCLIGIRI